MSAPDLVLRAVLESGLLARLSALHAETRTALAAALKVTERRPVEFAGTDVGVVSLKRGAVSARVSDADAFLEWAKEHRPDEVEEVTTYRVRPASTKAWLATLKAGGSVVSEATGEVLHAIPGLTIGSSSPTLEVRLEHTDEADAILDELFRTAITVGELGQGEAAA